jgi:hypothetical protein
MESLHSPLLLNQNTLRFIGVWYDYTTKFKGRNCKFYKFWELHNSGTVFGTTTQQSLRVEIVNFINFGSCTTLKLQTPEFWGQQYKHLLFSVET